MVVDLQHGDVVETLLPSHAGAAAREWAIVATAWLLARVDLLRLASGQSVCFLFDWRDANWQFVLYEVQ